MADEPTDGPAIAPSTERRAGVGVLARKGKTAAGSEG
jgi:hypothetical protein